MLGFFHQNEILLNFNIEKVFELVIGKEPNRANENFFYYEKLFEVVEKIRPFSNYIKLSSENEVLNGVFEIIINVLPEKQGYLFNNLLKLKVKIF